ncbi:MAG: hypothetical protein ACOZIN_03890 [Myxococcota bacterium]
MDDWLAAHKDVLPRVVGAVLRQKPPGGGEIIGVERVGESLGDGSPGVHVPQCSDAAACTLLRVDEFFPYHPRGPRRLLLAGALVSTALAAWAIANAMRGAEPFAYLRALVSLVLLCAMGWTHHRLRPRPSFGVRLGPGALVVGRPLGGELAFPFNELTSVRLQGRAIELTFRDGQSLRLPRQLFADQHAFAALARALEQRAPRSWSDA